MARPIPNEELPVDLPLLHFVLVAMWGGLVAAEVVLELLPVWRPELRQPADVFHYYIDLWVELPLLAGVLATGLLLLRGHSVDARLAAKLAGAGIALGANLVCVAMVIVRHRGRAELAAGRTRIVHGTAMVGIPGGLVALYLGLGYAGWLG